LQIFSSSLFLPGFSLSFAKFWSGAAPRETFSEMIF